MRIAIKYRGHIKEIKWNEKIEGINHAINSLNKRCAADHPCLQLSKIDPPPDGFRAGYLVTDKVGAKVPTTKKDLAKAILELINKPEAPNRFSVEFVTPTATQADLHINQEPTEEETEAKSTELATVEGEVVEEIPQELQKLPGGFSLTHKAKMALFKHIKTVVPDAVKMTSLQIGTIALDMFTRRVQLQKDVYFWLDWRGKLQSCDSVYYLKRWLSKIDRYLGGNGNIEIESRPMTKDERLEHGLNDNQIGVVALIIGGVHRNQKMQIIRQRAELMKIYKEVGFEPKEILTLVDSELPRPERVGVEGYAIVEKTYTVKGEVKETTPPNGWTLYQLAVKRAVKNAAKMWSTPNAQEAWELGDSRLSNEQFIKAIETNADTVLLGRDGDEIEKFAGYYLPDKESEAKKMTQQERVNLMRGDDGDDEIN